MLGLLYIYDGLGCVLENLYRVHCVVMGMSWISGIEILENSYKSPGENFNNF